MSKVNHTPEPWKFIEDGNANIYHIVTEDGKWIISIQQNGELLSSKQIANAQRIVECVNACAGLDSTTIAKIPEIVARYSNKEEQETESKAGHITVSMNGIRTQLYRAVKSLIKDLEDHKDNCGYVSVGAYQIEDDINTIRQMAGVLMCVYEEGNDNFKNLSEEFESLPFFNQEDDV